MEEKINKILKETIKSQETQENQEKKTIKEVKKTVQYWKTEIEAMKITQTKEFLEIQDLNK